jgi:tetratricopeptide (TPR) repeat protein
MMERFKQAILLLCLLIMGDLKLASKAWAQDSQIQKQLNQISQLEDKKQALTELSKLYELSNTIPSVQVKILLQRGKTFFSLHQYNQSTDAVLKAKDIAEQHSLFILVAQTNKMLGILFYYQGELNQALKAYQTSLAYYDTNQAEDTNMFTIERANLLNNIALVYTSLGQSNLSLETYQLAEPLYALYGDETDKNDVRYNIATLHISLRRYDIAIVMLKVIIEKRQQFKDEHGVATARGDLGVAYKHSGQFKLAKENVIAALHYFQKYDYKHDIASQLHNLSEIYNDTFDAKQATIYGKQAMAISKEVGHQKAYAGSLQSLAKAAFSSGDLIQATQYIEQSIAVGEKIDYQKLLAENLAISVLISASKQQYIKALSEQKEYEKTFLQTSNNRLNDKLAKFESEQLSQKIVDLEQRRKLQDLQSA